MNNYFYYFFIKLNKNYIIILYIKDDGTFNRKRKREG